MLNRLARSAQLALVVTLGVSPLGTPARADNSPEDALRRVEEHYLAKVQDACRVPLSVEYDGASLRAHNEDIRQDLTSGESACGEPLRYLWYACQSPGGRAAVKSAGIARIVCKGGVAKRSALTLVKGVLTVERAHMESSPHAQLRGRFEALLHVTLSFPAKADKDPDRDQLWNELQYKPNPTASTRDYCLVNGQKQEFDAHILNKSHGADPRVQCWKDGEPVVDMSYKGTKRTGFYTEWSRSGSRRFSYRDGERHGEQSTFEDDRLQSVNMYERGKSLWSKEFHPNGKLASYWRAAGGQRAGFSQAEDGKFFALQCAPELGGDALLRGPCGFEGARSTPLYDGTLKVDRVETWKGGVLQEQKAGDSAYAERSEVKFAEGKKHGLERVLDEQGKLAATISWNHGVKEGKETEYAEGGTKTVKVSVWRAGELAELSEFYLNGNLKRKERHDQPEHELVEEYWDNGKLSRRGEYVLCRLYDVRDWCQQGVHQSFSEDGRLSAEESFKEGALNGPHKSWWPNGKPRVDELYVDGRRTKSKRWDQDGKLSADEEYEADGSRKLKR